MDSKAIKEMLAARANELNASAMQLFQNGHQTLGGAVALKQILDAILQQELKESSESEKDNGNTIQ